MNTLETDRLLIRQLQLLDAPFILELLNEPSWLQYIGDKGVKTVAEAENYIRTGPMDMYARLGFGLFGVELAADSQLIGICGLIKRDSLDDVDIGFAFLERHWGNGYALESAKAVMEFAQNDIGLRRVVAITLPDNNPSKSLLRKLEFRFDKTIAGDPEALDLYVFDVGE